MNSTWALSHDTRTHAQMPNTQHYFENGTGRDSYITVDNGGFRPGPSGFRNDLSLSRSSTDLLDLLRKNRPARIRLPGITLASRRYMLSRQKTSCSRLSTPKAGATRKAQEPLRRSSAPSAFGRPKLVQPYKQSRPFEVTNSSGMHAPLSLSRNGKLAPLQKGEASTHLGPDLSKPRLHSKSPQQPLWIWHMLL